MKFRLGLFLFFLLVFLPFIFFPFKVQALRASKKAFLSAKKEYQKFAHSSAVKYRSHWLRVINLFRRVYLRYPESPEAPKALLWTARLYRNLYGYSHRTKDLKEALKRYRLLWKNYPESPLADDALYEAMKIYEDLLKNPQKALKLRRLILKRYPKGDIALKLKRTKSKGKALSAKEAPSNAGKALVKRIRYWSGEDYSRVVIDLSRKVHFKESVLRAHRGKPPRLYVDLKPAKISPYVKSEIPIQDGLLTRVRMGQHFPDTVRVVLDLKSLTSHRTFYLSNPPRVVIDLIGEENKSRLKPPPAGKYSLVQQLGLKIRRIVIDPGHGGRDPGAIGLYGLREKDLTLKVSRYLAKEVKRLLGCEVILTRNRDVFIPLIKRPAIANLKKADLFISIHVNAAPNRRARGIETYYLGFTKDPEAMRVAALENAVTNQSLSDLQNLIKKILRNTKIEESKRLAEKIQTSLVKRLSRKYSRVRNLGVKKAPFVVLIGARMPAVLVEISFITNPLEAQRLRSEAYLREIARGIAEGLKNYVKEIQIAGK